MISFDFATAGRIVFARGAASQVDKLAAEFGEPVFRVTGRRNVTSDSFVVPGEPTIALAREGARRCRSAAARVVVGIGGGSVIDAAKAIAALAANEGDVLDYIEVIGRGQTLTQTPLPVIAVPTTAGTGSEVTRNAVLGSPEHGVKASLRHAAMLPRIAVVDPELTLDLPPDMTAATGMDALTQLIEPYVSSRANAFTDTLCLEGIQRVRRSLRRAFENGRDLDAREDMCFASLLGGLALANAGLGVVPGFAAPVGGMYPAPHGAVCAAVLPAGFAANVRAVRSRSPELLPRFTAVARAITGQSYAQPEDAVEYLQRLRQDLKIPGLGRWGVTANNDLVDKASRASSMKANPLVLTHQELASVLNASL